MCRARPSIAGSPGCGVLPHITIRDNVSLLYCAGLLWLYNWASVSEPHTYDFNALMPGTEEVGHAQVSAFCIYSAYYLPLLKYTIFNCVL